MMPVFPHSTFSSAQRRPVFQFGKRLTTDGLAATNDSFRRQIGILVGLQTVTTDRQSAEQIDGFAQPIPSNGLGDVRRRPSQHG